MRHFFFILGFLSIGVAACTGCTKKDTSTPVCSGTDCVQSTIPVVVPSTPDAGFVPITPTLPIETPDYKIYSGAGWQLTAPQEWQKASFEGEELQPELVLANEEEHNLILLVKDPYPGSTPEYVAEAVKTFPEEGVIVKSNTQVELNGNKFIALDTERAGSRILFWIVVKDGFGYALSCGGPTVEDHHEAICNDVAKSLILK